MKIDSLYCRQSWRNLQENSFQCWFYKIIILMILKYLYFLIVNFLYKFVISDGCYNIYQLLIYNKHDNKFFIHHHRHSRFFPHYHYPFFICLNLFQLILYSTDFTSKYHISRPFQR